MLSRLPGPQKQRMSDSPEIRPYSEFLAPRHWPTWLGLGLLRLLHALPYRWQLRLSVTLVRLARPLLKRRVHIARRNLQLCFPERTAEEIETLLDAHVDALGMAVPESVMTWWGSDARLLALGEVRGMEHLEAVQAQGRGILLLTGHFTTMELASHLLGRRCRMAGMYRPLKNRLMDQVVLRARGARASMMLTRNEVRGMTRALRQGEAVWYGFDQNYGQTGAFVPFFGVPAMTITATSRFARMGRAAVVPFFPVRHPDGSYTIEIQPPLQDFPGDSDEGDARRLNALLEQAIGNAPEQYLWIHRRFKTRPPGEPGVY